VDRRPRVDLVAKSIGGYDSIVVSPFAFLGMEEKLGVVDASGF